MTLDLFSDAPATPVVAPRRLTTAQSKHLEVILEQVFAEAGRKGALKALDAAAKEALLFAVDVVGRRKRQAYTEARNGARVNTVGWTHADAELACAVAALHSSMLSSVAIPMAEDEAV